MGKKSKLVKAVRKLQMPAIRSLRSCGVVFDKPFPGIDEVARELMILHPELKPVQGKRQIIVEFDKLHHAKLGRHWVGQKSKRKTPARTAKTKAEFEAFYRTKEWRQLRFKAFLKYGRACMCCNAKRQAASCRSR